MRFMTDEGDMTLSLSHLVIAGWTARDQSSVDHHIKELAALGVSPPSSVPTYYRAAAALAQQIDVLDAVGSETSGEAEPLLIHHDGVLWLGLGSDHTDRGLESHSVALSKQVCGKPIASALWRFDTLADRLDELIIKSWVEEDGVWVLYQEGALASIRPLTSLIDGAELRELSGTSGMLCGTFPAIGGVRPATGFKAQLEDPRERRMIELEYRLNELPNVA